jgi:hypothetical protein
MNFFFEFDDLVLLFVQQASVVELSGSTLIIGRLEKDFSSEEAFDLVLKEEKSFVEVLSLFALDNNSVIGLELVDEVEKNIFMGE